MTAPEVRALFARGRAEIQGCGVLTPSGFAVAIVDRGVDAGISEFRRFVLGRTTSANTFEPRFEGTFGIAKSVPADRTRARAAAFRQLLSLVDQLQRVSRSRNAPASWLPLYVGPLEAAMLAAASAPNDAERACAVLDAAVAAIDRLDRNRSFRERKITWRPLPNAWLPNLFGDILPSGEARLALSLVSGFSSDRPFALYRFGVTKERDGRFVHPDRVPARWGWRAGPLPSLLCDVLCRATLDRETDTVDRRTTFLLPATHHQIEMWLSSRIDDALLANWVSRLALFDWSFVTPAVKTFAKGGVAPLSPSGALCLYGILQPFFGERIIPSQRTTSSEDLLSAESGARTPAVARALAALLRTGQVEGAIRLAKSRYAMARLPLIETSVPWATSDPERLLASLLFSVRPAERTTLVGHWLRPQRQGGHSHV